ncbi:hypothetical protein DQ04_00301170 [Trypanosoma grayi]|uniref:hypothetical protein n=1 Tax=Trypanosoma grayi TaxID=71804 RepID=UPI0004F4A084|nr:hypothetical protein DQ04_00301170 [Trypanosoma grayi]KEG14807.1 hypothetical protein DQ04_00301170 [Trypanosoma grayi]
MAEQRLLALRCWDACLRYELARSELWGRLQSGATSDVAASSTAHGATDWLEGDAVPSIADETVAIALRHIACEYLTASVEAINGMLRNFKSWNTNTTGHSVGAQRVSLRIFTSLLGSLALVASPAKVIEALWSSLLHIDGLLAECVSEARESRTVVESDESEAREQLLSSKRRWEHTRMLRERLQQHVHLATLHTAADAGVGADRSVSLIRRVVRIEEERQQQRSAEEAARVERLGHVGDTLKTLQEQLRVAGEYEALSLASLRDEQARRVAQLLDESRATHSAGRVGLMERQLGVLGRFAIGLSVANLGRREHEAILCRMRDAGTSNDAAAGDFTWLITDSAEFEHDYCAASVPTPGHDASPLQQCVLDASYYKASEATSTRRGCDIPPEDERRHVEAVLQETFASLARLNYVALPFLQCDAAALDAVVLFPSFELFVTQCELSVIGSSRLAFVRHSTSQLDADVAAYVKSLVQRKGSWIVDYAMSYDDFLAFLVDQAAVEYVRHAYLLTPRALLTRIVQEFVVPKWLARLKRDEQAAVHSNAIRERPTGCVTTASRPDAADDDDKNNKDNNDLCLLLDTAVTWLSIANRSLRDFAVAYRTHVVDYACAMKPEGEQTSCNTTRALMALLFPPQGNTRLRCNADRWEALQRSYGSTFAELSELVEDDGSLDGVTAWLSLVIDGISREDLMQRIADTVDAILRASLDDDDDGDACPARGKLRSCLSHNTPLSWILTLALCVRLSFDSSVVTPRLDGMLRFLTVSC